MVTPRVSCAHMEETYVRLGLERRIDTRGCGCRARRQGGDYPHRRFASPVTRGPPHRTSKHAVGGDDREVIFKRLRDEKSIERIPMEERQVRDSDDVSELNIQQP